MGPTMTCTTDLFENLMKKRSGPADVAVDNCKIMAGENCLSPVQEFICFNLQRIFFYGKEVRKAQPFSGMLWLTWNFGHLPLKFVFVSA